VRAWIGGGWTAVFIVLLLLTLAWHSALGVQVVVEDYVHGKLAKVATLIASNFLHAIAAAAGVFAVLKIAFSTGMT
jgi:succinate dehydrogenase / fumarate reductase membrane anchor subunit